MVENWISIIKHYNRKIPLKTERHSVRKRLAVYDSHWIYKLYNVLVDSLCHCIISTLHVSQKLLQIIVLWKTSDLPRNSGTSVNMIYENHFAENFSGGDAQDFARM